jgi:hypothetical protein
MKVLRIFNRIGIPVVFISCIAVGFSKFYLIISLVWVLLAYVIDYRVLLRNWKFSLLIAFFALAFILSGKIQSIYDLKFPLFESTADKFFIALFVLLSSTYVWTIFLSLFRTTDQKLHR